MSRRRLLVIGPVPPPVHGVTVSTSLVLASEILRKRFVVEHVDTSDHRTVANVGRWDARNIMLGLGSLVRLANLLRGERGIVYVPLSQNAPAFIRDSFYIHLARISGWTVVGHLRGSDFPAFYASSPSPLRRWIRLTLGRLESVAVMGLTLVWIFDGLIPRERIAVVPNGTPEPAIASDARPGHVVFLGNLLRRKGVVQAVEASLKVIERNPDAVFTFAGAWEDEQLARELQSRVIGACDSVRFVGTVLGHEKDELLASASILLFPPIEPEGHPRVVLEALAAGVPIVTTDQGAIRETVTDAENGFVLPDSDPDALAQALEALLRDEVLRAQFSRAARAAYEARYTQTGSDEVMARWLASLV
jgi:glycosyltransferase involved in cell wall biosynthesis